jgi:hypothetical protein
MLSELQLASLLYYCDFIKNCILNSGLTFPIICAQNVIKAFLYYCEITLSTCPNNGNIYQKLKKTFYPHIQCFLFEN